MARGRLTHGGLAARRLSGGQLMTEARLAHRCLSRTGVSGNSGSRNGRHRQTRNGKGLGRLGWGGKNLGRNRHSDNQLRQGRERKWRRRGRGLGGGDLGNWCLGDGGLRRGGLSLGQQQDGGRWVAGRHLDRHGTRRDRRWAANGYLAHLGADPHQGLKSSGLLGVDHRALDHHRSCHVPQPFR
ncbi:MAG TPA: hypothetical protein VEY95_14535 [Azospirillaceae bacterium]|nr:hypothetical protein [Azospirillaceae bacterium]